MSKVFKFLTRLKASADQKDTSNLEKVITELQESIQILDLENRKMSQDLQAIAEAFSEVLMSAVKIADHQHDQDLAINQNTVALSKVLRCLIEANLLDPSKPDPLVN